VQGSISPGLFTKNERYIDAGDGVLDLSTLASDPTVVPIRADVLAYAKQAGITGLRFPGGSVGEFYNWQDGIGPVLSRPTCANPAGPPAACYSYGIMEALAFAEALGPESVAWTEITLSNLISAQSAADFVAFVNAPDDGSNPWAALRAEYGHPQPYGVHYWCIGNEVSPWMNHYPNATAFLNGYSVSGQVMWDGALSIMSAMKAVDPTIAVGSGWAIRNNDLLNALQSEDARFDFVDLHTLSDGQGSGTTTAAQNYATIRKAAGIATKTVALQALINSAEYPALNGMTVISSEMDVGDVALRYSLSHALAGAVSLDAFIANGLTFEEETPFSALSSIPPQTARCEDLEWFAVDGSSTPPGDQFDDWVATAPSYTYQLYANYLGTQSVAATITSAPTEKGGGAQGTQTVYVTAALNQSGTVLGMIVTNADLSDSWSIPITVQGFDADSATVEQVDGPDVTSVNSLAAPNTVGIATLTGFTVPESGVFTYTFPPHSITAIDIAAPVSPPGTISGTVTDTLSGAVIPAATVSDDTSSTSTDDNGEYSMAVASGPDTVTASAPGYTSQSVQTAVGAGLTTELNFGLVPEEGAITGTVTDALTGDVIAGAIVTDVNGQSSSTDGNGTYVLSAETEGGDTVTASAPGYVGQSVNVSVAPGATTTSDFSLTPLPDVITGTVTDSVTGNGIAGAAVTDDAGNTGGTDGNGDYTITALLEGNDMVTASAPGYIPETLGAILSPGGTTTLNFELLSETDDAAHITGDTRRVE
jgi:alpha-L-arabinofuranosidase